MSDEFRFIEARKTKETEHHFTLVCFLVNIKHKNIDCVEIFFTCHIESRIYIKCIYIDILLILLIPSTQQNYIIIFKRLCRV